MRKKGKGQHNDEFGLCSEEAFELCFPSLHLSETDPRTGSKLGPAPERERSGLRRKASVAYGGGPG